MKKLLLVVAIISGLLLSAQAQDIIIRKDGSEIQVKVLEVNPQDVKYKRFDNQDGPTYGENKSKILKIKYANGTEDIFASESAKPVQEYVSTETEPKKMRKVRYSGLVEFAPYVGADFMTDGYGGKSGSAGLSFTTTHGIQIMDKYFIGMGTGLNVNWSHINEGEGYIPLYTTFQIDLSRAKARPFLSFSLGGQFGNFNYDEDYEEASISAGPWVNAMFGYRFENKLYVAIGLTYQGAYYYSDHIYNDGFYGGDVYESIGAMISFGIKF